MYDLFASVLQSNLLLRGISLFVFGIIIGSFLNVVIYRLPVMLKHKWHNDCVELLGEGCQLSTTKSPLNLLKPGSHCPQCSAKIPFWTNIPVVGYFLLKGKCFKCKASISPRYPVVEFITGALFAATGYLTANIFLLPALLVFIAFVICLILIDYDTYILPDELTLILMWLGILVNIHGMLAGSLENSVIGAVLGYTLLWLIFWSFKLVTGKEGMGYGDFKFLAAILAWTGFQALVPVTLVASVLGIIYFVILRIIMTFARDTKMPRLLQQQIPFGPFLGSAAILFIFANKYFIGILL